MKLDRYKRLYKIYSKLPLPREIWDTPEHKEYMQAFHGNKKCQEWELIQRTKKAGINYRNYCCIMMASNLIQDKKSKGKEEINYDSVMTYYKKGGVFGIPIHDGGRSFIKINYCPWCGSKLK